MTSSVCSLTKARIPSVGLALIVHNCKAGFNQSPRNMKYLCIWMYSHFNISAVDTSVPWANSITNVFAPLCPQFVCVCVVSHTVLLQALSPSSLMEMNVASSTLQRWFNHTNRRPKSPQCVRVPSLYTYESVCNTLCVIQNSCFGVRPQETEWDTEIEPISLCMKLQ